MNNRSEKTVHVPGGPARIFGMINTAEIGNKSASDIPVPADGKSATSEFLSEQQQSTEEVAKYARDAFRDVGIDNESKGIVFFIDNSNNAVTFDEMITEYSRRSSEGLPTDHMVMRFDMLSYDDELQNAVNAIVLDIDTKKNNSGWSLSTDNEMSVPVDDVISGDNLADIEDYADYNKQFYGQSNILDQDLYDDMNDTAKENTFSDRDTVMEHIEVHVKLELLGAKDRGISHGKSNEFYDGRIDHYTKTINQKNLSESFTALVEEGGISGKYGYKYDKDTESYDMDYVTWGTVIHRTIRDNDLR